MPEGDGNNGASVAWHPQQKKYYASFAGNATYPLAVFSENGKRLSANDLAAGFEVDSFFRGGFMVLAMSLR